MIQLFKSNLKNKRYIVVFENTPGGEADGSVVHFGSPEYENFTIHEDENRKRFHILRHQKNENWTENIIKTAGFWSIHILQSVDADLIVMDSRKFDPSIPSNDTLSHLASVSHKVAILSHCPVLLSKN